MISSEHYIQRTTILGQRDIPACNTDKFGFIPTTVFKYLDLSQNHNKQSLSENYLWFSDPTSFNDPFDCTTPFAYDLLSEDEVFCQRYYKDFSYTIYPDISESQRREFVEENVKNMLSQKGNKDYFENLYTKSIFDTHIAAIKEWGVLCTCMINDNILLWSHYAHQHTGICIEINTNTFLESLDDPGAGEVKYEKYPLIYPPFTHDLSEVNQSFKPIFLNKAPFWNYELEYRFFQYPISERKKNLNNAIKGIYMGMSISDKDRLFTIEICKKSNGLIKLFQAKKIYLKYELEFTEVAY
jgi:hypothetical protein